MKKKERDTLIEDLLAATSPEYLSSIREARADYKAGRVKTHEEAECYRRWFDMARTKDDLYVRIHSLPDLEKLRLVDEILTQLDKPDLELDRIWAEEARKRWDAYKAGRLKTVSYEEVMVPHRRPWRFAFLSRLSGK
jgi:putative addiction module component (TIGR02574 family)